MILLCELSFLGRAHIPFNAGLLATIQAAFPTEQVHFYGAEEHIEELRKQVGRPLVDLITWRHIDPPSSGTPYRKRFFRELRIIRQLLRMRSEELTSRFVLTSAYPSTVLALKVARLLCLDKIPVQVVLHGMSGVIGQRPRHPIRRFEDMKTAVTLLGNRDIQYLVLERSIHNTVLEKMPSLSGKIESFNHPISPDEGASQGIDLSEPIRFGFLGLADKSKGFPLFVEAANAVTARYGRRTEFHAIGHFQGVSTSIGGTEVLATKPTDMQMSRTDFTRRVSLLHFVVLPYEMGSYVLTASGVMLDAIAWQKPVIARRLPIFEAMFEQYGDIGYLFSHDEELQYMLEQILREADTSRYRAQVLNLQSARKSRAPEALAESYRDICKV